MTDRYEQRARELINNWQRTQYMSGEDFERSIAAALRAAHEAGAKDARSSFAERLRDAFYTERDEKAPGVWMFCRFRDTDGDELIQDDRLFPRHADAQRQIDAFVSALVESMSLGPPTSQPVQLETRSK